MTLYEARRRRDKAYRRPDRLVDAEQVRQHLRALREQGTSWQHATRLAGVSPSSVSQMLYGRRDRDNGKPCRLMNRETAEAILAVRHDPWSLPDRARVAAIGTQRRVQALVVMGWTLRQIAEEIGHVPNTFNVLNREFVTVGTAKSVRDLYDRWWNVQPPRHDRRQAVSVDRARKFARSRDWASPLAWDDATIDDPDALPIIEVDSPSPDDTDDTSNKMDEAAVLRIMDGTLRLQRGEYPVERVEAVRRLAALKLTDTEISRRIGIKRDSVLSIRHNNDISAGSSTTEAA